MADIMEMVEKLDRKLSKNNLELVYQELNSTIIEKYFDKFTKKQISKQSEDDLVDEVADMLGKYLEEPPFNLLTEKMTEEDFCLQAAIISKIIQES